MANALTKEELNEHKVFFVETTKQEVFKIERKENSYTMTDVTPPILEKEINDFCSIQLPKKALDTLKENPYYDFMKVRGFKTFEGIAKKGLFGFTGKDDNGMTVTSGTIDKLYFKQEFGNFTLNIHHFVFPGKKVELGKLLQNHFVIETEDESHTFEKRKDGFYYDEQKLIAVFSIVNKINDISIENILAQNIEGEFDVSSDILYINRPFILVTDNNGKANLSLRNDPVKKAYRL
ncbi:hypothetical protein D0469_09165 [Peribacillus saganii]|uniref:Uncharacterized protein n=1 Tax=Peribacillus saganii TaxID=2303992 RepID=A0A372LP44_9BACI|nr:hypothetical protein [Peribacillus saganii]RFU69525.1 hypothetical protein D0469_09165 [Peribacillus saganii]